MVEVSDDGIGGARANNGSVLSGLATGRGTRAASFASKPAGGGTRVVGRFRAVVVAEDSVLFREGLSARPRRWRLRGRRSSRRRLGAARAVIAEKPDVAVVDVRMPPTQTDEGTKAAKEIRERHPEVALFLLSQVVEAKHALELFSEQPEGFGYC